MNDQITFRPSFQVPKLKKGLRAVATTYRIYRTRFCIDLPHFIHDRQTTPALQNRRAVFYFNRWKLYDYGYSVLVGILLLLIAHRLLAGKLFTLKLFRVEIYVCKDITNEVEI